MPKQMLYPQVHSCISSIILSLVFSLFTRFYLIYGVFWCVFSGSLYRLMFPSDHPIFIMQKRQNTQRKNINSLERYFRNQQMRNDICGYFISN